MLYAPEQAKCISGADIIFSEDVTYCYNEIKVAGQFHPLIIMMMMVMIVIAIIMMMMTMIII